MGFSLGGVFKSLINPMTLAQLAMGPAGWASLAMRTIGSQIAMNLIQRIGQQIGLPQPMIDLAQAAFANASGQPGLMRQNIGESVRGFVGQMDLRPSEAGALQRELMGVADKSFDNLSRTANDFMKRIKSGSSEEDEEVGGSWLVALAKAMGKAMDKKAEQMKGLSDEIATMTSDKKVGSLNGTTDEKKIQAESTKLGGKTTLLQAYSQEMSMISNAASNVIKTYGEANTTLGRKG